MAKQNLTRQRLLQEIESLQKYLNKYGKDKTSQNTLNKLEENKTMLNNRKYRVAVVANMSSGKSTFINALFGANVLPTATEAVTDCATYIYPHTKEKYAEVYFNDSKKPVKLNKDELVELQEYAKKDASCKNPKHHNVEEIHLYYPFYDLDIQNEMDFDIVFIDTPGPNSNSGDYAEKHKDTTREVLRKANLALFLFNYENLDASFNQDEQGLWHAIRERKAVDKNFDVFFIVNRIDDAFNENLKKAEEQLEVEKQRDNLSAEEVKTRRKQLQNEMLGTHEKKAIEKVENGAKQHLSNDTPRVFGVSSLYQLYFMKQQEGDLDEEGDDGEKYYSFERRFERIYGDKATEKLLECLGFETLIEAIKEFLCNEAIQGVMKGISNDLRNEVEERKVTLRQELATIDKPEEEARKNIKKAQDFLEKAAPEAQKEMQNEVAAIQKDIEDEIAAHYSQSLQLCEKGVEDCVIKGMLFLHAYAEGGAKEDARKNAGRFYEEEEYRKYAMNSKKVELYKTRQKKEVMKQLDEYMATMLGDMQRDFLDVQTPLRLTYEDLEKRNNECLNRYKEQLQEQIGENLNVEQQKLELLETNITLPLDSDYLSGNVIHKTEQEIKYRTYEYDNRERWKPWTWFDKGTKTEKYVVNKNFFEINPEKIKQDMREKMLNFLGNEVKSAKEKHKNNISVYCEANNNLFREFIGKKQQELNGLERSLADIQAAKKRYEIEYNELERIFTQHHGE